jgi:hypothetical protein
MIKNPFLFKKTLVISVTLLFIGSLLAPSIKSLESKKVNKSINLNNEIDLIVFGDSWWSPAPWEEDEDFIGHYYTVKNIGDEYRYPLRINLSIYLIYPDRDVLYVKNSGLEIERIWKDWEWSGCGKTLRPEKPDEIRYEVETTAPESNILNNNITVKVDYGVTIYGKFYRKDIQGEERPIDDGIVKCNSDISPLDFKYLDGPYPDGSYIISAPKKPSSSPFKYTLIAQIGFSDFRTRIKRTTDLDEFEYTKIDFTFFFNIKSVNPIESIFQRVNNMHPLLSKFILHYLM